MGRTDLSNYHKGEYSPGAGRMKRAIWFCVNACFFASYFPFSGFKLFLLKLFGASLGKGIVLKPAVNIKYPWKLTVGNHVWIGEKVWIDNLDQVTIGAHSCLSQGAFILCGNHNFKKSSFDLMTEPVVLEEGVWICAKAIVCPGVTCHSHSVLTAGSTAGSDLQAYSIYQGNPALRLKERKLE
jgi:putative colanic acid biosynthesis acetyltransferase WcaF